MDVSLTYSLLNTLRDALQRLVPPPRGCLLGVSGGPDSVALLRGMLQLQAEFGMHVEVAHFNHGLRGGASDEDQAWVEQCSLELKVPCHVGFAISSSETPSRVVSSENALREQRLDFLLATARQREIDTICLGQHRQDQIETLLHRLARGTGMRGLAGIPAVRLMAPGYRLLRPLLECSRDEILAYLASLSQDYRIDHTNDEIDYTRNLIRHELLPLLEQVHPQAGLNLLRLHAQIQDHLEFLQPFLARLEQESLLNRTPHLLQLRLLPLQAAAPLLVRELFVTLWDEQHWPRAGMTQQHWRTLADFVHVRSETLQLPGYITARKRALMLILQRDAPSAAP